MVLKVLDVDGAVKRVKGGWISTGEPWVYDAERYGRLDDARQAEQAAMVEYQSITTCRMTFLREQLDDPGLTSENSQCGRCDNCTGNRYDTTVDTAALDETRARLQRPGFDLEPRKMWPTGLSKLGVKLSGKITEGPETGRILGRMSDLGWGQRLRALFDGPDARYPMRWSARVSAFWPPGIGPSDPPVSWPSNPQRILCWCRAWLPSWPRSGD